MTTWRQGDIGEANALLAGHHYLGPLRSGGKFIVVGEDEGAVTVVQVWKHPTARNIPPDGSWLELSRWCITPAAGDNAGSRNHRAAVGMLREAFPDVTSLLSYSDPSHGHGGALYRACNWLWAPTWHRLRPPPSGLGDWGGKGRQEVKDRWVFPLRPDERRAVIMDPKDRAAVRRHLASDEWSTTTYRWRAVCDLRELAQ